MMSYRKSTRKYKKKAKTLSLANRAPDPACEDGHGYPLSGPRLSALTGTNPLL